MGSPLKVARTCHTPLPLEVFGIFVLEILGHRLRRWKKKNTAKTLQKGLGGSGSCQLQAQKFEWSKHWKIWSSKRQFSKKTSASPQKPQNAGYLKKNVLAPWHTNGAQSVLTMRHVHTPEEFTVAWAKRRADVPPFFVAIPCLGCKGAKIDGHFETKPLKRQSCRMSFFSRPGICGNGTDGSPSFKKKPSFR